MAASCIFDSEVLATPATILDYGTLYTISCLLCCPGTLNNWKTVACKLGYDTNVMFGDFFNHSGCGPAEKMLLDFIHRKKGRIGQLIEVFKELELFACIDEMEKALELKLQKDKTSTVEDNNNDPPSQGGNVSSNQASESEHDDHTDPSKGVALTEGSVCDSTYTDRTSDSVASSKEPEDSIDVSDLGISDCTIENGSSDEDHLTGMCVPDGQSDSVNHSCNKMKSQSAPNTPFTQRKDEVTNITASDKNSDTYNESNGFPTLSCHGIPADNNGFLIKRQWPSDNNPTNRYIRSQSENNAHQRSSRMKGFRKLFRFRSVDQSELTKSGEKATKSPTLLDVFLLFWKRKTSKSDTSTAENVVKTCEGFHTEKLCQTSNNSPLKDASVKTPRPHSSSSDDSIPPGSPGYPDSIESGYDSGGGSPTTEMVKPPLSLKATDKIENSKKKIYIICASEDSETLEKACQLYVRFQIELGYQCHMSQIDCQEFRTNGNRYVYDQIQRADSVFLCVSEKLKETFDANMADQKLFEDEERTLRFSSDLILGDLAGQGCNKNGKFMTIFLAKDSSQHVPCYMWNYCKYRWPSQELKMENAIHNRPDIQLPPVSGVQKAPVQKVATTAGVRSHKET